MEPLLEKQKTLEGRLRELGRVAVAFSGGVDSTFLLYTAHDVLGDNVLAVTARSLSFPERELNEAVRFAAERGIAHEIVDSEELEIDGFRHNPANRCYLCKSELFTKIRQIAGARDIPHVLEGSNTDDTGDYRPGLQAVAEQGILSPLREAGLNKADIRELSRRAGLPTWDKQSFACLASRFPYGEEITPERLGMVDRAEQLLLDAGLRQVRVRHHGGLARIETDRDGMAALMEPELGEKIYREFQAIGFSYVTLDLRGYRTGSMNEVLPAGEKA